MKNEDDTRKGYGLPLLGDLFHLLSDMVETGRDEMDVNGTLGSGSERKATGSYRFNIKLGESLKTAGGSRIKSLDEILDQYDKKKKGPLTVEPNADIYESEDKVTVVVELPGVKREDIEVSLERDTLLLKASGNGTYYEKKIPLRFIPEAGVWKERFSNFIHTIEIEKPKSKQQSA